ncbi:hypothetical protein M758_1G052100 [Ceratodon purpureus]|nr:hypothetical protein M758_1G052100 [Ceratodon purpureus]
MAAVVQCANACSLRTGWTPSGVSSSGSGSDGVQSWRGRGFGGARFRKVAGERRGVVSMALAHGEEVEGAAGGVFRLAQKTVVALALGLSLSIGGADMAEAKRLEGVNKPELLPKEFTTVIDVAGFLSAGQEDRIKNAVATLEQDTGYKLRVLAQNYPTTPGLPSLAPLRSRIRIQYITTICAFDC